MTANAAMLPIGGAGTNDEGGDKESVGYTKGLKVKEKGGCDKVF